MRGRLVLAGLGVAAALVPGAAQFPPATPQPPAQGVPAYRPLTPPLQVPRLPDPPRPAQPLTPAVAAPGPQPPAGPRPLPPALAPTQPGLPDGSTLPPPADVPLPQPEQKVPFDAGSVTVKRVQGGWQVWAAGRVFRDVGNNEADAREVARVLRELRPTEWAGVGTPRPAVEYGLINGRPPVVGGFPKLVVPVDLRTARVEAVRGVWCVRDDENILFNFGPQRADADQALAVVRKYGFNRVGVVGTPGLPPALTYFFVALESDPQPRAGLGPLAAAAQEQALTRTGIPVPGVGFVGEMLKIDPRRVEARRDGYEWVVAHGQDVLGRFGPAEWPARDAARLIADGGFTEFCRVGPGGPTFFLVNGRAPTRVPFSARGRRFESGHLRTQQVFDRWAVTEAGRHLFDVASPAEGEAVVRLLRHYGFDQLCHVGPTPRQGIQFLARSR